MIKSRINDLSFRQDVRIKKAARAIIVRNQKIAVMYSKKYKFYMTPGGGVEERETFEEACIREAKEEAGVDVKPIEEIAILDSNYPRIRIEHHYFLCEYVEEVNTNRTTQETDQDLEVRWVSFEKLRELFSKECDVWKYDLWMRREYSVIAELGKYIKKE